MTFTPRQLEVMNDVISNICALNDETEILAKNYLLNILTIYIKEANSTLDNWNLQKYYGQEHDRGELERAIGNLRSCEAWLRKESHDVMDDYNSFEIMGLLVDNIVIVASASTRVVSSYVATAFRIKSNGASGGKNSGVVRKSRAEREWRPKARQFAQEIWKLDSVPTLKRTAEALEIGWGERYGEDAPRGYDTFLTFVRRMASAGELSVRQLKK